MRHSIIAALALALGLAGGHAGAEERAQGHIHASTLLGSRVENAAGNHLGSVAGLLFDARPRGQHYALLSVRDRDGEEKRFAYPVNAFRRGADSRLVLHVPVRNLELSPGYQGGRGWPSPEVRDRDRFVRARDVIGKAVLDSLGNPVGTMEDLVLDLRTGRMRYAMIRFAEGTRLPVAAHAIRLSPSGAATLDPGSQRRS